MPQTFSPQTIIMPLMAAPMAMDSQCTRAISVDPRAPVKAGKDNLTLSFTPISAETSTAGKVATSESALMPTAPTQVP